MALALLAVAAVSAQPAQGVLRITVTLANDAQVPTPVQRHRLFVSDNPPSAEPRAIMTAADGTVLLSLRPGSYIVESDRPVVFGGRAYQWTQVVEIVAGRDLSLNLTADNAEIVPLEALSSPTSVRASREELLLKYQESVVAVWSPTALSSGFVIDSRGLIATDGRAIGTATIVEVQLAPTMKMPARVLRSERSRDVAIVLVDPSLVASRSALALACPPSRTPSLNDGQAIATITVTLMGEKDLVHGDVTALQPRRVETDMRLPFGGSGGPVFDNAGAVVGLMSMSVETDSRLDDAAVVTTVFICEALAATLPMLSGVEPPAATRLPVEPTRPYPAGALEDIGKGTTPNATVPAMSSSDFDVAFITPPMVHRARQRSGWTGGPPSGRSPEAEERLGRLTEFGAWSDYFTSLPPVLIVRATPKMVEGFWKRLGREAARTQGAVLPAFKDFKTSFRHMRATCGGVEVTPIHPFVLEHRVNEKNVIREGLYVFDPDAIGPQCGMVTLSLYSEGEPERPDTLTLTRTVIDRLWTDFAAYRATGR
jgi:S1-C subfamily serine protease